MEPTRFDLQRLPILLLALASAAPSLAGDEKKRDPDEAALASYKPRLAEPMVFDLVRPLGADKGEFEVNTLFQRTLRGPSRELEWAPEVEFAFAEGLAVEFEFPFENSSLGEYKVGFQATAGVFGGGRAIHGIQTITRVDRAESFVNQDVLHLVGVELDPRWSVFLINGVRRESDGQASGAAAVTNATLFRRLNKHTVLGVESNLKLGGPLPNDWLLMPQAHFNPFEKIHFQFGVGAERRTGDRLRPAAAMRLIREF